MTKEPKDKKFSLFSVKKIAGGKDPLHLVEEFILKRGFDPDECRKSKSAENARWVLPIADGEELEVLVEGLDAPQQTTIYMGLNVLIVPVRGAFDVLAIALQVADGLVGIKVSLVGHYLVLSATLGAASVTVEDLDYHFSLITAQQSWFKETVLDELGVDELPEG